MTRFTVELLFETDNDSLSMMRLCQLVREYCRDGIFSLVNSNPEYKFKGYSETSQEIEEEPIR